jgi:hypothetical protein
MINEKLNFEDFKKFDFILYDQYLFKSLLDIYKKEKVKYKILAINVFKEQKIAPIVIDIKSMSPVILLDYYENIYLLEQTDYLNKFDQMGLVQNLIKTKLDLDELSDHLTKLMLINNKTFFRYYDPRILIHLYVLNNTKFLDSDLNKWFKQYCKIFDSWAFDLMSHCFEIKDINYNSEEFERKSKINLDKIDQINDQVRKFSRSNSDFDSVVNFIRKQYLDFEINYER